MTIRDNVEAVHRLLAEELKVTHLRAVIGFSMGAQQAFQWAVSHPDFVGSDRRDVRHGEDVRPRRACGSRGRSPRSPPTPRSHGGDYTAPPVKGLEAFGMVWAGWLYSQEWWRRELWQARSRRRERRSSST